MPLLFKKNFSHIIFNFNAFLKFLIFHLKVKTSSNHSNCACPFGFIYYIMCAQNIIFPFLVRTRTWRTLERSPSHSNPISVFQHLLRPSLLPPPLRQRQPYPPLSSSSSGPPPFPFFSLSSSYSPGSSFSWSTRHRLASAPLSPRGRLLVLNPLPGPSMCLIQRLMSSDLMPWSSPRRSLEIGGDG